MPQTLVHVAATSAVWLGLCLATTSASGQEPAAPRRGNELGFYLGFVSEASEIDGTTVKVYEAEAGRIGLLWGRWSAGWVNKPGGVSLVVSPGPTPPEMHVRGVEVGRLLHNEWIVQPGVHATVGRINVVRGDSEGAASMLELMGSVGITGWIFRLDVRAGARLGGNVTLGTESVSTSSLMVGFTASAGRFAEWKQRKRAAPRAP